MYISPIKTWTTPTCNDNLWDTEAKTDSWEHCPTHNRPKHIYLTTGSRLCGPRKQAGDFFRLKAHAMTTHPHNGDMTTWLMINSRYTACFIPSSISTQPAKYRDEIIYSLSPRKSAAVPRQNGALPTATATFYFPRRVFNMTICSASGFRHKVTDFICYIRYVY